MQFFNVLVAAIILTLAPTGISGEKSVVSVSNCTTLNLKNCYSYKDTIDLDLRDFCIPCGEKIFVVACSTENQCFKVGEPEYGQKIFRIKIQKPFFLEVAYTLKIWQVGGSRILETSPFLVSNRECCAFCRGPEEFIIDTPVKSCYEYGDTLIFKYRALCFRPNEKILIYINSEETTDVCVVEMLSTNALCGQVAIRIVEPTFVRGGNYLMIVNKIPLTFHQFVFRVSWNKC